MKAAVLLIAILFLSGCNPNAVNSNGKNERAEKHTENRTAGFGDAGSLSGNEKTDESENSSEASTNKTPKNVRDFFMLLPARYFEIECCNRSRTGYLKNYLTVEDAGNGYLEGSGDGAQNAFKMALFKRPDGTYIVGFNSYGEAEDSYYFLVYEKEKWSDISLEIVPEYTKKNIYEFPRFGTTIPVFAKKIIEESEDFEASEKGEKLYDLEWKNGEFRIKK